MNPPTEKTEAEQLTQILTLLEETYSSKDSEKIKYAQGQLLSFSANIQVFSSLLYKSLLLSSLNGKPISLDLHKSVVIYLRNILLKNGNELKPEEIFEFLKNICMLFFSWEKNNNLNNGTITIILQNIVTFLLSINSIKENPDYIENLFSDIFKILSNSQYTSENNILITCEKIIGLSLALLTSKSTNSKNYENLISKYFLPIVDKILELRINYLNPEKNIFNNKYCLILKNLFDGFYNILSYLKTILLSEIFIKVCTEIFKKYWKYSFELIQISPPLDEPSIKKFEKSNPIIILSVDEKKSNDINSMKSRVIQLISYTVQSISSISNDFDFINQENDNDNNKKSSNKNNSIKDNDLTSYIINMIKLTVKCFEDLLSNKEKYYFVRNYNLEVFKEENSVNIILYELCVFLTRVLVRQPFKNIFAGDIRQLLLNILFPLFSTNETEKNDIEKDFYMYHVYLNDITDEFKMRNFRTSGMFLINKICDHFPDENNFILSFSLEMFNYTINNGNLPKKELNYNIYLENKDKYKFDKLDQETKIDFFLLLILLLIHKINRNNLFKVHLKQLLIENQDKLQNIQSLAIKIKLCKIYSVFVPSLFRKAQISNLNNPFIKLLDKQNNQNKELENINFTKEYKFVQNAIDYLLKNIAQNITPNNNISETKEYYHSLSHMAAESLSEIIETFRERKNEEEENEEKLTNNNSNELNTVNDYISKTLSENFKIIINLILIIDNPSFYNLIDYEMEYIKAQDKQEIFICLNNITQKFINDLNKNGSENQIKPFIIQYFKILSSFLKGVNKLNKNDTKEIELFEEILNKIFTHININNLENFEDNDELIDTIENYIKIVEYINDKSIKILKCIIPILKKENVFSNSLYSFLSTFMKYLPKTNNIPENTKLEMIDEIIKIIKLSFTFNDDIYDQSVKNALLLTLKLFNISINGLSLNTLKELLLLSLNSFAPFSKEDLIIGEVTQKSIINQLCLCNISYGFIFRPVDAFKIILESDNNKTQEKNNSENNNKGKLNNPTTNLFFNLIVSVLSVSNNDYIILLNKCIILGLCSLFKEDYCKQKLNIEKDLRIFLLQIFLKLIDKHKKQQIDQLNKLMKKETNCNFIDDQDNEEEEDEEDEDDDLEEIRDSTKDILFENENIKNADEYKFFAEIINDIKNNDNKTFELLNGAYKGRIDELLLIRNININYKGKQFTVPRKTVKIVRK